MESDTEAREDVSKADEYNAAGPRQGKRLDEHDRLCPSEHASAETQSTSQNSFLSSTWWGRGKSVAG